MSIRIYLILSYLGLIILLAFGMWAIADRFQDKLAGQILTVAKRAVQEVTAANTQATDKILTTLGEYVVKDKAEDVARELANLLAGKKTYDYAALRRNPKLRKIAIQNIYTPAGPAGYTDLYDKNGFILFHPDKNVEGRNQLEWQEEYPETTELVRRSFSENNVSGYYTFFDQNNRQRTRYSVRVHVPGTPFIVAAIVNLDEFFLPTQEKIQQAGQEISVRTEDHIAQHQKVIDQRVKLGSLIAGLALAVAGILSGFWLAGTISRPILRLRDGVRQVGEGDFAVAVPAKGVKEVVHLAQSFNQLGQQLTEYIEKRDFIRDTFGRYVTQEVAKRLLESKEARELGGETREVTILISDLRGFTALTADLEPEAVVNFLNRYLGKMIEILTDHRAVIDEIIGDGILAFFGAPEPMADHPVRAVACALAMQAAMDEVNALNHADGLPHLEMGVAVNTGEVVVGNIGSERRTKYSVVGAQVNLASRIEAYAVGGQVLIGPATYKRVADLIEVGETMEVGMKGVPGKTTLYEVQGIGEPYNIYLKEKYETLTPLSEKINLHLQRISEKIIVGRIDTAWVTQLSETTATVILAGELGEWEDVRLRLLDKNENEVPGKVYGKVTSVKPGEGNLREAQIRFTSVSPEIYQFIRQALGRV
ncbi:MAG: adenylate/guanylate cyclase domain-containing protein [Thermodesulfobacteriota bacterium]